MSDAPIERRAFEYIGGSVGVYLCNFSMDTQQLTQLIRRELPTRAVARETSIEVYSYAENVSLSH